MRKGEQRNRPRKDAAATRTFWTPNLEAEAKRLEGYLARKLSGAVLAVGVERQHIVVYGAGSQSVKKAPVRQRRLRLTPINTGIYRLSYFRHTGRWWPLPYTGTIRKMASIVASHLAPPLEMT